MPKAPVPPQNLEAEDNVVGAMMLSPNAIDAVAEILQPDDFYRPSHGRLYAGALELHATGGPVDALTLADYLEARPAPKGNHNLRSMLEFVGGKVRLHELANLVPATANAAHYARIVRDMATLRGLQQAGQRIAQAAADREGETPDLVEEAERLVLDLSRSRSRSDFIHAAQAVREAFDRLSELAAAGGRDVVGMPTGLRDLDRITAGFHPGNLIVLAARPSMGKSGLALTIVDHLAVHQKVPVGLVTLEMSMAEVTNRLLSIGGFVDSHSIRTGRLHAEDWTRITGASGRIADAPLFVDDAYLVSLAELRTKSRRLKARHPDLGLIVVDYLQLMTAGGNEESRQQQIAAIARSLKVLAGELEVPVLALSQLNRGPEMRHDKRPLLADLRESGEIEQSADVVLLLYRDEYYHREDSDQAGIAEVNVAKQRNGPTATVKLAFVERYARFSDLAPEAA